jgi:hypothetical protein
MLNIFTAIALTGCYLTWGLWNIDREWTHVNDVDTGFLLSLAPLAIAIWTALYLVGA